VDKLYGYSKDYKTDRFQTKVVPVHKHDGLKTYKGTEVKLHACLTSALYVSGQLPSPLGKEPPVPIGQEARWAQRVDLDAVAKRKIPVPAGNRNSVVQPVASQFSEYAHWHTDTVTWIFSTSPVIQSWICYYRAGIAQWYSTGLRAGGLGVRVLAGAGYFSLHYRVQNGSGAHPSSYPMGTRGSFPGDKAAGVWCWPLISI
jgi:hypothetical protein